MSPQKQIMDQEAVRRAVLRISHEIIEKHRGTDDLCLIGIRTRGAIIAERIQRCIEDIEGTAIPVGILDITLYRDDLTLIATQPVVHETQIDFDITDKRIVLVDDVLYTGRTVRAALDAIIDFGRPSHIQLGVLVDRGHRELPIRADYVGKNLPTAPEENVKVILKESDEKEDKVIVLQQEVS